MKVFEILAEAQFRQPRIMYHGTSSEFLAGILKNGLVPDPPKKRWDSDNQQVHSSFSRVSLPGSYWTSNLMTAQSSATNTTQKHGGTPIIVVAQIAEQSSYADEDNVNSPLLRSVSELVQEINPGIRSDIWIVLAAPLFARYTPEELDDLRRNAAYYRYPEPRTREQLQEMFAQILHRNLGGSDKHVPNRNLTNQILDALVLRYLAFEKKNGYSFESNVRMWMGDKAAELPPLPSIAEAEETLLRLRDQLTRSYRASAYHTDQFSHTLRTPAVVGFRGANRILQIVEMPQSKFVPDGNGGSRLQVNPMVLIYGRPPLPEDFATQYRSRVGKFPGLVNRGGQVLIPSERE